MNNEKEIEEKLDKIYRSRRLLKKIIRGQERRLAYRLANKERYLKAHPRNSHSIENAFEWFLTWRLKLTNHTEQLWCDGVEELKLVQVCPKTFEFEAMVRVGPEGPSFDINICRATGTLLLDRNDKELKGYYLEIQDIDQRYIARKKCNKRLLDF